MANKTQQHKYKQTMNRKKKQKRKNGALALSGTAQKSPMQNKESEQQVTKDDTSPALTNSDPIKISYSSILKSNQDQTTINVSNSHETTTQASDDCQTATKTKPSTKKTWRSYLPVKLNSKPVNAIIDTTTSANCIRSEAVPDGTTYHSVDTDVHLLQSSCAVTKACYIDTEFDGKICKIKYFVLDSIRNMIVFGLTWIEEYKVSINIPEGIVTFEDKTLKLTKIPVSNISKLYYGQSDLELWVSKGPVFIKKFLGKIREEMKLDRHTYIEIKQMIKSGYPILNRDGLFEIDKVGIYVPLKLRKEIIKLCHERSTEKHLPVIETWNAVRENNFYWIRIGSDVGNVVRRCSACRDEEKRRSTEASNCQLITNDASSIKEITVDNKDRLVAVVQKALVSSEDKIEIESDESTKASSEIVDAIDVLLKRL